MELDAIAAVVIGGTLLTGGSGYVLGTVLGVLVLGLIQTLITFDGTLSSWWTKIVIGVLLFAFILLQRLIGIRKQVTAPLPRKATHMTPHTRARDLVPHRQPGPVRRGDPAPGGRPVPARSPRQLDASPDIPARVVWKPVLTSSARDPARCAGRPAPRRAPSGVIAWMHTFSPAKMWICRAGRAATPLLHLHTQANVALPWGEIDMDFMNLNQAAHGDREFGYIQTRLGVARKTVAGHVSDPRVIARIGAWARAALGWPAMRSLRLARFGDNMRDVAVTEGDKVEAQLRFGVSVNTYGVNDLVDAVDAVADAQVDELVERVRRRLPRRRASCAPAATGTTRCATRPGSRLGLRDVPGRPAGSGRSPRTSRTSAGCASCPGIAVQRLMADGYGFGGEGDWKTSVLVRTLKAMAVGVAGGTSFMEDYTYDLTPGQELVLGAHMLEVCPSIAAGRPERARSTRWASAGGRTRSGWCSTPRPARRSCVGLADMGERFRLVANEIDVVRAAAAAAQAAGRPRGLAAAARPARLGRGVADRRRRRTTRCCRRRSAWRSCTTSRR